MANHCRKSLLQEVICNDLAPVVPLVIGAKRAHLTLDFYPFAARKQRIDRLRKNEAYQR